VLDFIFELWFQQIFAAAALLGSETEKLCNTIPISAYGKVRIVEDLICYRYVLTLVVDGMRNVRGFHFDKAASSVLTCCVSTCLLVLTFTKQGLAFSLAVCLLD
jgi:hypothetical protein